MGPGRYQDCVWSALYSVEYSTLLYPTVVYAGREVVQASSASAVCSVQSQESTEYPLEIDIQMHLPEGYR